VTVAAALGLSGWTARFPSGAATIAIAEDPDAARLLGIRPHRVAAVVWAIAGVLAAVAGVLLSGFTVLNGTEMTLALTTSLAAALVAGFSSIPLAVLASAAVGAVSAAASSIPRLARISGFDESVGFILVVLVALFLRPRVTAASLERA
jgi:branched-chain amino acid transport system permease protein